MTVYSAGHPMARNSSLPARVRAAPVPLRWLVAEGRPQGEPQLVKPDIGSITPLGVTEQGALYYSIDSGGSNVQIATLDPATWGCPRPGLASVRPLRGPQQFRRLVTRRPVSRLFLTRRGWDVSEWSPEHSYSLGRERRGTRLVAAPRVVLHGVPTALVSRRPLPPGQRAATSGGDPGLFQIDVATGEVTSLTKDVSRHPYGEWSADGREHLLRASGP